MSEVRLIDANALKEWLAAQIDYYKKYSGYNCNAMASAYGAVLERIDNEPTVDAAPVVPAHWIMYSYDEAICSHCGYDRTTEFECTSEAKERWSELPKFCENCGERMDGADGERTARNESIN